MSDTFTLTIQSATGRRSWWSRTSVNGQGQNCCFCYTIHFYTLLCTEICPSVLWCQLGNRKDILPVKVHCQLFP